MKRTALVLEGGGLRGVFVSGVLEAFLEAGLFFTENYGVSAGASNAVTYLARQRGRNERVFIDYIKDPRYMGFRSLVKSGDYFNKKFIFEDIPTIHDPFDYDTFFNRKELLFMPITDALTGEPRFLQEFNTPNQLATALKAATSLPVLSRPVWIDGRPYFDGGISCPIIVDEVMEKAFDQIVFVLTQPLGYQKEASSDSLLHKVALRKYPAIRQCLSRRHEVYNRRLERIGQLEKEGRITVIRPDGTIKVRRTETNQDLMRASFHHGKALGHQFCLDNNAVSTGPLGLIK